MSGQIGQQAFLFIEPGDIAVPLTRENYESELQPRQPNVVGDEMHVRAPL
jgi:hypothetical protein